MTDPITLRIECPYDDCSIEGLTVLPAAAEVVGTSKRSDDSRFTVEDNTVSADEAVEAYCEKHTYYVHYRQQPD